jgi:hypothetical protein
VGLAITARGVEPVGTRAPYTSIDADPPSPRQLAEIGRWIAPEDVPVRFDAAYYAVAADDGIEPVPDGTETAAAWWAPAARLLEEWEAGERRLYWPTWLTVTQLAACASVEDLLALRIDTREPDEGELASLPPSVFWQDR